MERKNARKRCLLLRIINHPVKIYIRLLLHDEVGVNWELTGNRVGTGFVKIF